MRLWLFKSEPDVFSFDDLKRCPKRTEPWNGVRNYQVRNFMRDDMLPGDLGFFYHSSCPEPGVPGVVRVASEGRPDPTALDPRSEYFDPKSDPGQPRWYLVDVEWATDFKRFVPLSELREQAELADMLILRRGNRLSITPVEPEHFDFICRLGGVDPKKLRRG
ncbi:MAG: EVE domain-containing protein [Verrucomicrobiae bacterium]|nr:EVE domain-containing protein [Verrucomicrobiae bacterium]